MNITTIALVGGALLASFAFAGEFDAGGYLNQFPVEDYRMMADGRNPYWRLSPGRYVVRGALEVFRDTPDQA